MTPSIRSSQLETSFVMSGMSSSSDDRSTERSAMLLLRLPPGARIRLEGQVLRRDHRRRLARRAWRVRRFLARREAEAAERALEAALAHVAQHVHVREGLVQDAVGVA